MVGIVPSFGTWQVELLHDGHRLIKLLLQFVCVENVIPSFLCMQQQNFKCIKQFYQMTLVLTELLLADSRSVVLLKFLANGTTSSPTLCPCASQVRSTKKGRS